MFDKIITGIGLREARASTVDHAFSLGREISDLNILLRTGDAVGMDTAFLQGWSSGKKVGDCIVYGPKLSYSAKTGEAWETKNFDNYIIATECVKKIVPHWDHVYAKIRKSSPKIYENKISAFRDLHIRNYFQIMGDSNNGIVGSDMLLFAARRLMGVYVGGTATTIAIANEHDVPIYDIEECSMSLLLDAIRRKKVTFNSTDIPF